MAAQVGLPGLEVMDRMSVYVLDEEQLEIEIPTYKNPRCKVHPPRKN